jgi:hypothetical protein
VRRHRTGNLGNLADAAIRQQEPQRGKFKLKGKIEVREYGQLMPPLRLFLIQRVLKSNTPLDLDSERATRYVKGLRNKPKMPSQGLTPLTAKARLVLQTLKTPKPNRSSEARPPQTPEKESTEGATLGNRNREQHVGILLRSNQEGKYGPDRNNHAVF